MDCLHLKTDQSFGILLILLYYKDSQTCYFHVQVLCVGYSFGYTFTIDNICLPKQTVGDEELSCDRD